MEEREKIHDHRIAKIGAWFIMSWSHIQREIEWRQTKGLLEYSNQDSGSHHTEVEAEPKCLRS